MRGVKFWAFFGILAGVDLYVSIYGSNYILQYNTSENVR